MPKEYIRPRGYMLDIQTNSLNIAMRKNGELLYLYNITAFLLIGGYTNESFYN